MTVPVALLTGAGGQLGHELRRALAPHCAVTALDRSQLDLGDPDALVAVIHALKPQLIVNAAAYTAVDRAEQDAEQAHCINALAPGILAEQAKRADALLVHYSTDYVFDGAADAPYQEDDVPNPLSVYGRTKLEGERAIAAQGGRHLVFRTSWVYGRHGKNFLLTMQRLAAERDELRVVADQIGVPNWSRVLARATAEIIGHGLSLAGERGGLYHLSSRGRASWFDFASAIVGDRRHPRVIPIATSEYPLPARRPACAVLATGKFERTFGFALPEWRSALAECLSAAE